jgi:DNA-binding response OmpR family regulator
MEQKNKRILIVEDDLNFLSILQQAFEEEKFQVVFAKDGEEGLSVAKKEMLDLIILDILMPKMSGTEMAEKLRELNIRTPIIFLTNVSSVDTINKVIESMKGNVEYIIKTDVHIDQIVERVKEKLK